MPGIPWWGDSVTFTIVPLPAGSIARAKAASAMFSMPSTFSRHTARQPFAAIPSAGVKYWPPALFTSTSSLPWRSSTLATIRSASSRSRMSPAIQSAARRRSPPPLPPAPPRGARRSRPSRRSAPARARSPCPGRCRRRSRARPCRSAGRARRSRIRSVEPLVMHAIIWPLVPRIGRSPRSPVRPRSPHPSRHLTRV